ncbi:MAG TPA: trypsin-like peptidase domain-containing protein [Bryobacteraceae bacterium]|jgi:S1-C subfamily serine protease|nr:trypsin-like peptidase domain-containing protein [Bryobacteraceae bacterium]
MRLSRIIVITALLVSGFLLVTTKTDWGQRRILNPVSSAGPLWSGPSSTHATGLSSDETNNIDIYKSSHLATVNITSTIYRRTIFMEVYPSKDQGSGFLISADGKILTNNHVVANERQLEVTLSDQSRYKAQLLSRDEANDLALLQITPRTKLPSLHLGDSDALQVGQKVLAIGNPFGLEGTLTTGIVSSLGRSIRGENERTLEGLIQTDAAINPGNSGGPLLDSAGNVVGINTAILGPNGGNIGIGFAMPINRAKLMLDDFQAGRKRPKLGVSVVPIAGDYADALRLPTQGGLLIQEVDPDSAAARAGLRGGRQEVQIGNAEVLVGGDLIMSIDGKPVERDDAISRALAAKRTGDTLELTIFRNGKTINVRVRLGEEGAI